MAARNRPAQGGNRQDRREECSISQAALDNFLEFAGRYNTEVGGVLIGVRDGVGAEIYGAVFPPQFSSKALECAFESNTLTAICDSLEFAGLKFAPESALAPIGWVHTHPRLRVFLSPQDTKTFETWGQLDKAAIAMVLDPFERHAPKYLVWNTAIQLIRMHRTQADFTSDNDQNAVEQFVARLNSHETAGGNGWQVVWARGVVGRDQGLGTTDGGTVGQRSGRTGAIHPQSNNVTQTPPINSTHIPPSMSIPSGNQIIDSVELSPAAREAFRQSESASSASASSGASDLNARGMANTPHMTQEVRAGSPSQTPFVESGSLLAVPGIVDTLATVELFIQNLRRPPCRNWLGICATLPLYPARTLVVSMITMPDAYSREFSAHRFVQSIRQCVADVQEARIAGVLVGEASENAKSTHEDLQAVAAVIHPYELWTLNPTPRERKGMCLTPLRSTDRSVLPDVYGRMCIQLRDRLNETAQDWGKGIVCDGLGLMKVGRARN